MSLTCATFVCNICTGKRFDSFNHLIRCLYIETFCVYVDTLNCSTALRCTGCRDVRRLPVLPSYCTGNTTCTCANRSKPLRTMWSHLPSCYTSSLRHNDQIMKFTNTWQYSFWSLTEFVHRINVKDHQKLYLHIFFGQY